MVNMFVHKAFLLWVYLFYLINGTTGAEEGSALRILLLINSAKSILYSLFLFLLFGHPRESSGVV